MRPAIPGKNCLGIVYFFDEFSNRQYAALLYANVGIIIEITKNFNENSMNLSFFYYTFAAIIFIIY